jgi:outer membrane protein assembly factor BamB
VIRGARPAVLVAALLGVVLALAGCAGSSTVIPPAPLPKFRTTLPLRLLWSHAIGSEGGRRLRLGFVPAVAGGAVYVASRSGRVAAYRLKDGHELWVRHLGRRLSAGPAVGSGIVAVGTQRGELVALAQSGGRVLWRARLASFLLAPPAVADGRVVALASSGQVAAFSARRGRPLWTVSTGLPHLVVRGNAAPLVAGRTVLVGLPNGKLLALALATGRRRYERRIGVPHGNTSVARLVDVVGPMALAGHDVYVSCVHGRIERLTVRGGRVVWSHRLSVYAGVRVDDLNVYTTTSHGLVRAYDRVTGFPLWTNRGLRGREPTVPVRFGPAVAVGDFRGYVFLLGRNKGRFRARVRPGTSAILAPPVVASSRLVVLTSGGTLAVYGRARS